MILDSTRSKCLTVIAPHNQIITVKYHAPDLALPEQTMEEATRKAMEKDSSAAEYQQQETGLDSQWNKRMRERLERIKSKKFRDISISVSQKGPTISAIVDSRQTTGYDSNGKLVTSGSGRIREELVQKEGRIEFLTGKDSGTIEVCMQSILASPNQPERIHIQVEEAASDDEYDDDDQYLDDDTRPKEKKTKDPEHLEHREITTKMSRLERDLQTLHNRVKACLNNADFNKEQEASFHEQSISMNRAARYWPMIQLVVLLITGFTQANHIVRYMKTHHIV